MKLWLFLTLMIALPAVAVPRVLMMIPNDFMWPEYSEPRLAYEAAGFQVTTAGQVKEARNPDRRNAATYPESKPITPDLTFDEVSLDNFDAITFVAGNGAWHDFFPNQRVHDLVQEAMKKKKVVGLLCASTGLLGLVNNWDGKGTPIAKGKKAVGYFRVEGIMKKLGQVKYIPGGQKEPGTAIDGNLITGRNPESSKLFGAAIVAALQK